MAPIHAAVLLPEHRGDAAACQLGKRIHDKRLPLIEAIAQADLRCPWTLMALPEARRQHGTAKIAVDSAFAALTLRGPDIARP